MTTVRHQFPQLQSTLDVVVGAQFGSEAKGHLVVQLATHRAIEQGQNLEVIRVAGPNAGHSGVDARGKLWAFRQLPVAAVVDAPMTLTIAPGSEIDMGVLLDEIDSAREGGLLRNKIVQVNAMATLITHEHRQRENDQGLSQSLGSTAKGIGAARSDRIMRRARILRDDPEAIQALLQRGVSINPSSTYDPSDNSVIVEGTQGYGLGLHTSYYPQTTSSNCRAIDFLAMAGISPWSWPADKFQVWLAARVYPIRVAGNSGPMRGETSWEEMGLDPEFTTVTRKKRRVGAPDWDLVRQAVLANGGPHRVQVGLFMMDQWAKRLRGLEDSSALLPEDREYIRQVEKETGATIALIGTSPSTVVWL